MNVAFSDGDESSHPHIRIGRDRERFPEGVSFSNRKKGLWFFDIRSKTAAVLKQKSAIDAARD